ncbi:MAG: CHAT domain-containing protein [Saprospiraceae bacterium]|nr:CHAT domain-containing protein [Saprospiraceae bacterium]
MRTPPICSSIIILLLMFVNFSHTLQAQLSSAQIRALGINEPAALACKTTALYYHKQKKMDEVLKYLELEAAIRKQLPLSAQNDTALCKVYYNLSKVSRVVSLFEKALMYNHEAYTHTLKLYGKKHIETLDVLGSKAEILMEMETHTEEALILFNRVIEDIELQLGKPSLKTVSFRTHVATIYYLHGHLDKSMEIYEECLDILDYVEQDQASNEVARIYNNMAQVKFEEQNFSEAIGLCQKALDIRLNIYGEHSPNVAYIYDRLAFFYSKRDKTGEDTTTLYYAHKGLGVYIERFGEHHLAVANSYNFLADYFLTAQTLNLDSATYYNQKTIDVHYKLFGEKSLKMAYPYFQLGKIYLEQKDWKQSLAYFRKALAIYQQYLGDKHPDIATAYTYIARVYEKQKQYETALGYYQNALVSNILDFNSLDYLDFPNPNTVRKNTFHRQKLFDALIPKMTCLYKLYQSKKDIHYLKQAFQQLQYTQQLVSTFRHNIINDSDKHSFLHSLADYYNVGLEICWTLHHKDQQSEYIETALNIFEHNKSIYLSDLLEEASIYKNQGLSAKLIRKYKNLRLKVIYHEQEILEAKHKHNKQKTAFHQRQIFNYTQSLDTIYTILGKRYSTDTIPNQISIQRIQQQLDPQSCLVNYYYKNDCLYSIFVEKNRVSFNKEVSWIKPLLNAYFKQTILNDQNQYSCESYTTTSHQLYQVLLGKHFEQNQLPKHLIIIPNNWLNYLTFESLVYELPQHQCDFRSLDYLIQKSSISYNYSIRIWQLTQQQTTAHNTNILGFAPDYSQDKTLKNLDGAYKELEFLEKNFEGSYHYGQTASEKQFKKQLSDYGILHLAMHSEPHHQHSLKSRLIFSPSVDSSQEDNFLYTYELAELPFQAQLVVLSACQTGSGQLQEGEGIMSLARGFVYARVPSLVMTLWKTNDYVSMQLVQSFYQNLAKGLTQDKALQAAKLEYLENCSEVAAHPHYWAPFIHFGDTCPIQLNIKESSSGYRNYSIGAVAIILLSLIVVWRRKRHKSRTKRKGERK